MQSISLTTTQKVKTTVTPQDSAGNTASVNSSFTPIWSVDNPNGIQFQYDDVNDPHHYSAFVVAAQIGVYVVTVSGGTFTSTFQVTVTAGAASQFGFTFDPPIAK